MKVIISTFVLPKWVMKTLRAKTWPDSNSQPSVMLLQMTIPNFHSERFHASTSNSAQSDVNTMLDGSAYPG